MTFLSVFVLPAPGAASQRAGGRRAGRRRAAFESAHQAARVCVVHGVAAQNLQCELFEAGVGAVAAFAAPAPICSAALVERPGGRRSPAPAAAVGVAADAVLEVDHDARCGPPESGRRLADLRGLGHGLRSVLAVMRRAGAIRRPRTGSVRPTGP
jgi:hypothetical protein